MSISNSSIMCIYHSLFVLVSSPPQLSVAILNATAMTERQNNRSIFSMAWRQKLELETKGFCFAGGGNFFVIESFRARSPESYPRLKYQWNSKAAADSQAEEHKKQ